MTTQDLEKLIPAIIWLLQWSSIKNSYKDHQAPAIYFKIQPQEFCPKEKGH